jgi:hypothetical protein
MDLQLKGKVTLATGRSLGVPPFTLSALGQLQTAALARGLGDLDHIATIQVLEEIAGIQVRQAGSSQGYCAVHKIGDRSPGTAQSGGESEEGRRPAPLGRARGEGRGLAACPASPRAFPANEAARANV